MSINVNFIYVPASDTRRIALLKPVSDGSKVLGHYLLSAQKNQDYVTLMFNSPELNDPEPGVDYIHQLEYLILREAEVNDHPVLKAWSVMVNFYRLKLMLERVYWKYQVMQMSGVPLVSAKSLYGLVQRVNKNYPKGYVVELVDVDLGDVINETGLWEIDHLVILNMLSHFLQVPYARKAELMTVVAFRHHLPIHPLAVSVTPWVIGVLRFTKHLK